MREINQKCKQPLETSTLPSSSPPTSPPQSLPLSANTLPSKSSKYYHLCHAPPLVTPARSTSPSLSSHTPSLSFCSFYSVFLYIFWGKVKLTVVKFVQLSFQSIQFKNCHSSLLTFVTLSYQYLCSFLFVFNSVNFLKTMSFRHIMN